MGRAILDAAIFIKYPLNRWPRDARKLGDTLVRLTMGYEPQHLHPATHRWLRVLKTALANLRQNIRGKAHLMHPCTSMIKPWPTSMPAS